VCVCKYIYIYISRYSSIILDYNLDKIASSEDNFLKSHKYNFIDTDAKRTRTNE